MKKNIHLKILLVLPFLVYVLDVFSAAIYPINNAAILSGSKFDIKIELDKIVQNTDLVTTLNGRKIEDVLKKTPEFISNEGGKGSSLIFRDISIDQAGSYVLEAQAGIEKLQVTWDVYGTGSRKAKNIILFIAQ